LEHRPLIEVWARNGMASVTLGSLEDAGFHPVIEWDPRGPMHFYGWPLGSSRPLIIWIPAAELEEARSFLAAPCEPSWQPELASPSFARGIRRRRRVIYGVWLASEGLGLLAAIASTAGTIVELVRSGGGLRGL
jgi:hypothetical protein